MNTETARKLASTVARESHGVSVKLGQTNGQPVLHLIRKQTDDLPAASLTISSPLDWQYHDWNTSLKPKTRDKTLDGLEEAIANKEAQ